MINLGYLKTFFIITIFICTNIFSETTYDIIEITSPDCEESIAYAINDRDEVVGTCKYNDQQNVFLWNKENGTTILPLPSNAIPKVINNRGQIAGEYKNTKGVQCIFIFDPLNGFKQVYSPNANIWVSDMNELGDIVGFYEAPKNGSFGEKTTHAFLFRSGSFMDLGFTCRQTWEGYVESRAYGINNFSEIVGYTMHDNSSGEKKPVRMAILWKPGEVKKLYPSYNQHLSTESFSINDIGQVISQKQKTNSKTIMVVQNIFSEEEIQFRSGGDGSDCLKKDSFLKLNELGNFIFSPHENSFFICEKVRDSSLSPSPFYGSAKINKKNTISYVKMVYDINNKNNVVGAALDVLGKKCAILLKPENQKHD